MAQIVKLVDDLDGLSDAEMTLEFGLDGTEYAIDLNDENYETYRAMLELLASKGRVVKREPVKVKRTLSTGKKTGTAGKTTEMREWLRANGHQVSDRGRVPQSLVDLYETRPRVSTPAPVEIEAEKPSETPETVDEDKAEENAVIARVKNTPKPAAKSTRGKGRVVKSNEMPELRAALSLVDGEE